MGLSINKKSVIDMVGSSNSSIFDFYPTPHTTAQKNDIKNIITKAMTSGNSVLEIQFKKWKKPHLVWAGV